jgi:MFS family permease
VGVLFAMYAAGLLIATPIFGILTDRFGRKWPMLCGLVGLGAATSILAFIRCVALSVSVRAYVAVN